MGKLAIVLIGIVGIIMVFESCDTGSNPPRQQTPSNPEREKQIKALIEQLKDKNWDNRRSAAHSLGELGAKEAISELIKLLNDENWDVCEVSSSALTKLNAKEVIPELIKLLKDGTETVRWLSNDMCTKLDAKYLRGLAAISLVELGEKNKITQENIADIRSILSLEWYTDDLKKRVQKALKELGATE